MYSKNILNTVRIKNAINIIFPGILLTLIIVFYIHSPLHNILNPVRTDKLSNIRTIYSSGNNYVNLTVNTLYDSGLDCIRNGKLAGRYYYAFENNYCYFFLISNKHLESYSEENDTDLSALSNFTIKAGIQNNPKVLNDIINHISRDLSWTAAGMDKSTSGYLISEPDYPFIKTCIIFAILLILTVIATLSISYSLICICCPYLYKSIIKLRHYGKIKEQIRQVNSELRDTPSLNDEHFIITKNYLLIYSSDDFQIIPLSQIIWAYKFSSYHPLKYRNRKITYTLCVYGRHNVSLISPHHSKYNTDRVLEYLSDNHPDILIGYSREYENITKFQM